MVYSRSNEHGHVRVNCMVISVSQLPQCSCQRCTSVLWQKWGSLKLWAASDKPCGKLVSQPFLTMYFRKLTHYQLQTVPGIPQNWRFPSQLFPPSKAKRMDLGSFCCFCTCPRVLFGEEESNSVKNIPTLLFWCLFLSCSVGKLFGNTTVLNPPNGTA